MLKNATITRDQRLMIIFSALRNVTDLFFTTFFISYVMQLSFNEIIAVANYKLFEYFATAVGFFFFARWCKQRSKTAIFALNLLPQTALLLSIIFLGDSVINYIIPMGIMFGIGAAMYHLPMHLMVGEKVAPHAMPRYIGAKNTAIHVTKVMAPVTLGLFITAGSYTEMAAALLVLTAIEAILMLFLSPSRHRSRSGTDFVGFTRCMLRFPIVRKMMSMEILRGFAFNSLPTLITMYTVYIFKTDLKLGALTTVFSLCSILASLIFSRYGRRDNFVRILMLCSVMILGGLSWFVIDTTPLSFVIYNFVYATAIITMTQICDVNFYNLSQSRCVTASRRVEYFVFRDAALFIGRWVSFVLMLYIGVFGDASWLRYYLALITVAAVATGVLSVQISNKLRSRN